MNCKIDTKETFWIITPNTSELNNNMTDELTSIVHDCEGKALSVILDFSNVNSSSISSFAFIQQMHDLMYSNEVSFVVTNLQDELKQKFITHKLMDQINVTPTLIEAIDIVAMENLERELLNGE